MSKLTYHFIFLLLSCVTIIYSQKLIAEPISPFEPVYSEGDDLSLAIYKPKTIYKEVSESKIEIKNMPAIRTQDELGECGAFSLATIIQKYTCDKWKKDIPDCSKPPSDLDISSFGALVYTNHSPDDSETLEINGEEGHNMYAIIDSLKNKPLFILNSCKSFDKMVNNFSLNGQVGIDQKNKFFSDLEKIYNNKKLKTEAGVVDCSECLTEINKNTGLNTNLKILKEALTKENYNKFLYTLFFSGCKFEPFADGFKPMAYPAAGMNVTPKDIKNKVIDGLKKGKPVLYPWLCLNPEKDKVCKTSHSIVISGYKKVCDQYENCKDVFKVHNSWGEGWQKRNNDGWLDADLITQNLKKDPMQSELSKIKPASVIWLEP